MTPLSRPLPGAPAVLYEVWADSRRTSVHYSGSGDDLIATGCATAALLGPWRKGAARVDERGHRVFRQVLAGGVFRIRRYITDKAYAESLPGVAEWFATPPPERPDPQPLPELAEALRQRYPRLRVQAELVTAVDGSVFQYLVFEGSESDLKLYGLATDELMNCMRDGRRRDPEDGFGNSIWAIGPCDESGLARARRWVLVDDDRPLPKWAEVAGERIVKRLRRRCRPVRGR